MRTLRPIAFLVLACLISTARAAAQRESCRTFKMLDEHNGLSDHHVHSICQDRNGFIWVGTASGLNRIDGSSITVYKSLRGDAHSLSSNNVTALACDGDGTLWIGTGAVLNRMNPLLGSITRIPLDSAQTPLEISAIQILPRGRIAIGSTDGLFFYESSTGRVSHRLLPGTGLSRTYNNRLTGLAQDGTGSLCITTYQGLWCFDEASQSFVRPANRTGPAPYSGLATCCLTGRSGVIWVGTWNDGLLKYDPQRRSVEKVASPAFTGNVQALAAVPAPDGGCSLWINGSGLQYDVRRGVETVAPDAALHIEEAGAKVIFQATDGWIWAGTDKGLFYAAPHQSCVHCLRFGVTTSTQVNAILPWQHGFLVTGDDKFFLRAYTESLQQTADFHNAAIPKSIACMAIQRDGNDGVACGTTQGVAQVDLASRKVRFCHIPPPSRSDSRLDFVTTLAPDFDGGWWLFPWRNGIWHADSAFKHFRLSLYNLSLQNGAPRPFVVVQAVNDDRGNLWCADVEEGVIFYDRRRRQFSSLFANSLGPNRALSQIVFHGKDGYTFQGTAVLRWNMDTLRLYRTELSPVVEKNITSMAFDAQGRLWLATRSGLFSYEPATGRLLRFTTADGLPGNELDGTLCAHPDGYMVFAGAEMMFTFRPAEMMASLGKPPELRLSGMMVNGKAYLHQPGREMEFGNEAHDFEFNWAVTDFKNPLDNHYYYRLQGVDTGWRDAGKTGSVDFRNLAPGSYRLWLKGENTNGVTAANLLDIRFRIRPPFWSTLWFDSLVLLALAAIFYALYRFRLRQLLKIEKLRNKISLDLHDDIGSTLSSIAILSDMGAQQRGGLQEAKLFKDISEQSSYLMDRMDDIVWSINPKNDSSGSLFSRLQNFASRLLEARDIRYRFQVDDAARTLRLPMDCRQHIYLIMKEAVNNLAKYSACTEASVRVAYEVPWLRIDIRDNGIGFDAQQPQRGNGIMSMKKRAAAMKAQLQIDTAPGKGTHISLAVKIA